MQGDKVTGFVNFLQVGGMAYAAGKAPCGIYRQEGVVAQHFHIKMAGKVGHHDADGAQTDDAQTLAAQFGANKLLLARFHQLGNLIALALQGLCPLHGGVDLTGRHQQTCNDQFLYGIGVAAWGVEYNDALFGALVDGNVVDACACTADGLYGFGQFHFMHAGAAQHNAFRFLQFVWNT